MSARTRWPLPRSEAEGLARTVLRAEGVRRAVVSIAFVGRQGMRTLNRRHLGHDRPTDVLAFALTPGPGVRDPARVVVGDIYVCGPSARPRPGASRRTAREELRRLVVHGVLHVLGYDHPPGPGRTASPDVAPPGIAPGALRPAAMNLGFAIAITGAALATAWSALLSLADGALAADPSLAETVLTGAYGDKPERFRRALALGRIVFLALAAVGASGSLAWWHADFARTAVVLACVVVLVARLGRPGAPHPGPVARREPAARGPSGSPPPRSASSRRSSSRPASWIARWRGCSASRPAARPPPPIPPSATCCSASSRSPTRW